MLVVHWRTGLWINGTRHKFDKLEQAMSDVVSGLCFDSGLSTCFGSTALVSTGASIVLPNSTIWAVNGVRWCPRGTDELGVAKMHMQFLYSFMMFDAVLVSKHNMSCGHSNLRRPKRNLKGAVLLTPFVFEPALT